ncbi:hypothetical protein Tcan_11807 [Toxocara canis]|uniref:Uncharacterized protein n=1 Tax=Toxocara canis TaxID=6265 RepID=A0A0B2VDZ1_TOXCA|nr:hypothetical protein Tcan_11807 [Toxocara canis]
MVKFRLYNSQGFLKDHIGVVNFRLYYFHGFRKDYIEFGFLHSRCLNQEEKYSSPCVVKKWRWDEQGGWRYFTSSMKFFRILPRVVHCLVESWRLRGSISVPYLSFIGPNIASGPRNGQPENTPPAQSGSTRRFPRGQRMANSRMLPGTAKQPKWCFGRKRFLTMSFRVPSVGRGGEKYPGQSVP